MADLTEITYYTRRVLYYGFLGVIVFIILRIIWGIGIGYWKRFYPPPPSPPTVAFGKLAALKFPQNNFSSANFSYSLETIEGKLPEATPTAKVYRLPKPSANFLAFNRAKDFARRLGFKDEPTPIGENLYQWTDPQNPLRTLKRDIITGNFTLAYDYREDPSIFSQKELPSPADALEEARSFLQNYGLYPEELATGEATTVFGKFSGSTFVPVYSLSEADIVRVDFFRATLDDWPLLPPNFSQSFLYLLFSGSKIEGRRIFEAHYTFWPISEGTATYPLKKSKDAWEELKDGKAYVASPGDGRTQVVIRKVFLGYYDSEEYQSYLQPIFVFEGDGNFVAYVPAVNPQWQE